MAQAGYCSECNANVWLGPDGGCCNGHPAASVSNTYETPAGPPAATAAKHSNTVWIVLAVVAVLLLCGIAGCALAVPVFLNASSDAAQKSCFANERVAMGAYQVYLVSNDGAATQPPADWEGLMSLVVPTEIKSEPRCPAGGVYSIVPDDEGGIVVDCSIHGSVGGLPQP